MSVLINPGSGPVAETGDGWTNSYEGALAEAQQWLSRIHADGMEDVKLVLPCSCRADVDGGRWSFGFYHPVSGVVVVLQTHGVSDVDAYMKERIFPPRVYWNGSSSAEPKVEDWLHPGYQVVKTLRATP